MSPPRAFLYALAAGYALARPAILGFNPCNGFFCTMNQYNASVFRSIADAIVSTGLRDAGYVYFNLDDGYVVGRDPVTHQPIVDNTSFPAGLAPWTAYLSSLGLRAGLYTDRGTKTCEGRAGSQGYEAIDAAFWAANNISYVKCDSCDAPEQLDAAFEQYQTLQAALNATGDVFFSLCGWWPCVAPFMHDGAWPDIDMIGGHWPAQQEVFHLSLIALISSPLLLSWDVRSSSASTLPLSAYTNGDILTIHQDAPSRQPYYSRLRGGELADAGVPLATTLVCNASDPSQQWNLTANGTLSTAALPGWCLSVWSGFPGGCPDNVQVSLLPCGNVDGGTCCGQSSPSAPCNNQMWTVNATGQYLFSTAYSPYVPSNGGYMTYTGVPGAMAVQAPMLNNGTSLAPTQQWLLNASTSLLSSLSDGTCIGSPVRDVTNVWCRWMSDGSLILLFASTDAEPRNVTCDAACFADAGYAASTAFAVRDVWASSDAGNTTAQAGWSTTVPGGGSSRIFRFAVVGDAEEGRREAQ